MENTFIIFLRVFFFIFGKTKMKNKSEMFNLRRQVVRRAGKAVWVGLLHFDCESEITQAHSAIFP